jgi:hypothetical protein
MASLYSVLDDLNLDEDTRSKILEAHNDEEDKNRENRRLYELEEKIDDLKSTVNKILDKMHGFSPSKDDDDDEKTLKKACKAKDW